MHSSRELGECVGRRLQRPRSGIDCAVELPERIAAIQTGELWRTGVGGDHDVNQRLRFSGGFRHHGQQTIRNKCAGIGFKGGGL